MWELFSISIVYFGMNLSPNIVHKVLRYIAQAAIVYLLFRYFPGSRMRENKAMLASGVILAISLTIEYMCMFLMSRTSNSEPAQETTEGFKVKPCGSCKVPKPTIEGFEGDNNKCRVVCDSGNASNSDGARSSSNGTAGAVGAADAAGAGAATAEAPSTAPPPASPTMDRTEYGLGRSSSTPTGGPGPSEYIADHMRAADKQAANDDRFYWGTRYGNLGYDDRYGFGGMFYDEYPFYNRFRNSDYASGESRNLGTNVPVFNGDSERREQERVESRRLALEGRAVDLDGYDHRYQDVGSKSQRDRTFESRRRIEGELDDEIPYSDYNHLPIAAGYKSHDYEYGYSFLPPEKWYPQPPRPPICVTEKRCPVCPVTADGTPTDVKEFHSSRRITPPDLINTDYIGDKLNAGR